MPVVDSDIIQAEVKIHLSSDRKTGFFRCTCEAQITCVDGEYIIVFFDDDPDIDIDYHTSMLEVERIGATPLTLALYNGVDGQHLEDAVKSGVVRATKRSYESMDQAVKALVNSLDTSMSDFEDSAKSEYGGKVLEMSWIAGEKGEPTWFSDNLVHYDKEKKEYDFGKRPGDSGPVIAHEGDLVIRSMSDMIDVIPCFKGEVDESMRPTIELRGNKEFIIDAIVDVPNLVIITAEVKDDAGREITNYGTSNTTIFKNMVYAKPQVR